MTIPFNASTPSQAVIEGVDVDRVAAAVLGCPGVAALDGGQFGEVATYLPRRTLPGVLIRDGRVTIRIRAEWVPAPQLAALITTTLMPLTSNRPVDVVIADIEEPHARPWPSPAATGVTR
jgi:hypothetical protein